MEKSLDELKVRLEKLLVEMKGLIAASLAAVKIGSEKAMARQDSLEMRIMV